ncbi:MAG: bifunctional DNA-formamidopyrimidine glycosylase/DNA-(apurinic or apyrimidinic site) lyase [Coriobacteriia bacterium]|nr:bifunctional DNA-formamidopyrimidine glycosylase/DNA-(apurinic or apyrimidinic site) lyase [Coriobacteriia bacterium]
MPELPEVEVIRRGLAGVLTDKVIIEVTVLEQRSFPGFNARTPGFIWGARVDQVKRRGKMLMIELIPRVKTRVAASVYPHVLMVHLRMTGQLIYRSEDNDGFAGGFASDSLVGSLPDKSTRVIIDFIDGSKLFFNDQRKFGYMKLMRQDLLDQDSFLSSLGPEPLDETLSWQDLRKSIGRTSTTSIKAALLDQKRVAGIGNIYADESLFRAKVDPRRSVASLSPVEFRRLLVAIRACLRQSIADGGSTARNYVNSEGLKGEFLDLHAAVYGRTGLPCPHCGTPITKIRVAGRGTHLCEKCQV